MKGQVSSQVFMFIMAAIVIGIVVIVGARSVVHMSSMSHEVSTVQFERDIENTFSNINYGDLKITSFNMPTGVREVCFCGSNKDEYNLPKCTVEGSDEINKSIRLMKNNNDNETVFIILSDGKIHRVKIPNLYTEDMICISNNQKVKIEGVAGGNVLVSRVE